MLLRFTLKKVLLYEPHLKRLIVHTKWMTFLFKTIWRPRPSWLV